MVASQHTTNIPSQTPHGEVINDEAIPPPLEDIPREEAPHYVITKEQLRALHPAARNLIRDLRYAPIMSFLTHTRTPAENITRNGALVSTIPQLVNLIIEDLATAAQGDEPIPELQDGDEEEFGPTEPFPDP